MGVPHALTLTRALWLFRCSPPLPALSDMQVPIGVSLWNMVLQGFEKEPEHTLLDTEEISKL